MNKKTILIVVGIIVAVVGFLIFTQPNNTEGTPSEHKTGAGTSGVTLIEYGDFQCSACAQYFPILQQVKQKYGDEITFQFRHFPIESSHKNARAASLAAEAASNQGKFWEMHDQLFIYQLQWQDTSDPLTIFEGYAKEIGVGDLNKFREDYKSSAVSAVVNADLKAGRDLGVNSTPSFVVDGKKLEQSPAASLESFSELLDSLIKEKTGQDSKASTAQPIESTQEPVAPVQ